MTPSERNTQTKSHGWLWKIPLGVVLLLLIGLSIIYANINSIAKDRINRELGNYLAEGGSLETIDIGLLAGRIDLGGLKINPPKGHGTQPLLSLGNMVIDVVPLSLIGDVVVVEEVRLDQMAMNLVRDKQGRLGLANLLKPEKLATREKGAEKGTKATEKPEEKAPPVMQVNKIRLENSSITIEDHALTGKPMVFPLTDIRLAVDQLRLFDESKGGDPAAFSMALKLKQPGKLPAAHFGTVARIGPVGRDVPPVNAQARMIGLKLKTLGALLPPATRSALGGDGLDAGQALALNDGRIHLDALAVTDRNVRYDTIKIRGPLNAPKIEIAPVLAGVFRVKDGVLNLGKSGLGAGISIAEGGVNVAKEVGTGALKVGKKLLGGLFDTGKGIATLDAKQMEKGIVGSTAGTIELSLDTVGGAGSAVGGGLGKSASQLMGSAAAQAWDKGIPTRFKAAMQHAEAALAKMPYPPVTN